MVLELQKKVVGCEVVGCIYYNNFIFSTLI